MVKHTQTIRRQPTTNSLSVFDHCVGLAPKGLSRRRRLLVGSLIQRRIQKPIKHLSGAFCENSYNFQLFSIFARNSILDVRMSSECASVINENLQKKC